MTGVENLRMRQTAEGTVLAVKAVPGASRDRVVGVLGDALKVATSAAAERGKANAAIARILAETLGVDPRTVRLAAGAASPRKEFLIAGRTADDIRRRLR